MRAWLEGDLAAVLRVPAFRRYVVSRIAAGIGQSMLQAIIAWQVYAISASALDLGIIGLVRFAPALALSLISGVIVDTYDRQRILLVAQSIPVITSSLMLGAIATNGVSLLLVYGLVFMAGVASAFEGPSRQALIPALVPRYLFSRAMTLNSTLQSLSSVSGPAVAGLLIAWQGIGLAYAGHLSLILVSMLVLLPVRVARSSEAARAGMRLDAFVTWRVPALRNHQRRFSS